MKLKKISGIYGFVHKDEIVYIGQSKDVFSRIAFHLTQSPRGKSKKRSDFIKKHRNEIESILIEECDESKLSERERYYVLLHKPKFNIKLTRTNEQLIEDRRHNQRKTDLGRADYLKEWRDKRYKLQSAVKELKNISWIEAKNLTIKECKDILEKEA